MKRCGLAYDYLGAERLKRVAHGPAGHKTGSQTVRLRTIAGQSNKAEGMVFPGNTPPLRFHATRLHLTGNQR